MDLFRSSFWMIPLFVVRIPAVQYQIPNMNQKQKPQGSTKLSWVKGSGKIQPEYPENFFGAFLPTKWRREKTSDKARPAKCCMAPKKMKCWAASEAQRSPVKLLQGVPVQGRALAVYGVPFILFLNIMHPLKCLLLQNITCHFHVSTSAKHSLTRQLP